MTKYYYAKNDQEYDVLMEKLEKQGATWGLTGKKPREIASPQTFYRPGVVYRVRGNEIAGWGSKEWYAGNGVTDFIEYPFEDLQPKKESLTKAEVIEKLKEYKKFTNKEGLLRNMSRSIDTDYAIKVIEKMKEPEKPVIPQMAADYLKECKKENMTIYGALNRSFSNPLRDGKLFKCLLNNQDLFAAAWINDDYEVIKEPMYKIPLGLRTIDGEKQYLSYKKGWYFASRHNDYLKQFFTETELEDVPERYRDLAEKVEDHENKS